MEIKNKAVLKDIIRRDLQIYHKQPKNKLLIKKIIGHPDIAFIRFLTYMRKEQYYKNHMRGLNKLLYLYYMRKKNKYGIRLGIELHGECVGAGIIIRHYGCITVNAFAKLGNNCILRGDNCVGVARDGEKPPRIGNNVDLGFGAKVIGDIDIADDCIIGANAVVVHSCFQKGAVLVGIPAKVIRPGDNHEKY